jgi:hypothetical protein
MIPKTLYNKKDPINLVLKKKDFKERLLTGKRRH